MPRSRLRRAPVGLMGLALVAGAVVLAVRLSGRLPDGPVEVVWDGTRCAHCRMLVSDPGFAAQLQTADGRVLDFDDPGCLLLHLHEQAPPLHAAWFHHHRDLRWIPGDRVAFVPLEDAASPMGYGLAAYDRDEVEGLAWEAALEWTRRVESRRSAPEPRS